MFALKAKTLDVTTGDVDIAVLSDNQSARLGILPADRVIIRHHGQDLVALIDVSSSLVKEGEIGLFRDICQEHNIKTGDPIAVEVLSRPDSIEAIKKRLLGHTLSEKEIKSVIRDLVDERITDLEAAYFVASSFLNTTDDRELYYLTKAMVETGDQLKFTGTVVDIHSIGGLPGNRTTMLAGPILATIGFTVPKTSTRAITSPAGVADTMGYLAEVELSSEQVKKVVQVTDACLVTGEKLNLAPADDKFVRLTYPLALEPYSKMIVSIIAKKAAMNIKYLLIEMPIGSTAKIDDYRTAKKIAKQMIRLGKKFDIRVGINYLYALEPTSHGIGPALEAREVLRVFQQKPNRSQTLERQALTLAAQAAALTGKMSYQVALEKVNLALKNGQCWRKFQAIMRAQKPKFSPDIDSEAILKNSFSQDEFAAKSGKISQVDNKALSELARSLGAPIHPRAGIYTYGRVGQKITRGDKIFTMFAETQDRLEAAEDVLSDVEVFRIR